MAEDTTTVKQESEAQGDAIVRRETVRREQGAASGVVVAQRVVWFFIGFIVTKAKQQKQKQARKERKVSN